jgi:hypothetical protein
MEIKLIQKGQNFSINIEGNNYSKRVVDKDEQADIKALVKEATETKNASKLKGLLKKINSFFGVEVKEVKVEQKVVEKKATKKKVEVSSTNGVEAMLKAILKGQEELKERVLALEQKKEEKKKEEESKPVATVHKRSEER